jgi:MoaA/NifB/PqqE/SkfB family radical SAM enzyme
MPQKKIIFLIKKTSFFWKVAKIAVNFVPPFLFKKVPKEVIIEPTNACNLRCPVCPTHLAMKRARGFIDFELFKSIIDEFKEYKEKPKISMNFSGEPLLHPRIDELVSYASKNQHKTFISTNACNLTRDLSERLISAGLSHVHLCIDGMTKKSHEAYRIGSNFEGVKRNIEDFMLTKKKPKKKKSIRYNPNTFNIFF